MGKNRDYTKQFVILWKIKTLLAVVIRNDCFHWTWNVFVSSRTWLNYRLFTLQSQWNGSSRKHFLFGPIYIRSFSFPPFSSCRSHGRAGRWFEDLNRCMYNVHCTQTYYIQTSNTHAQFNNLNQNPFTIYISTIHRMFCYFEWRSQFIFSWTIAPLFCSSHFIVCRFQQMTSAIVISHQSSVIGVK